MKTLILIITISLFTSCGSIFKPVDVNKLANTGAIVVGGATVVGFLDDTVEQILGASPGQREKAKIALDAFRVVIEAEKEILIKNSTTTINLKGLESLYKAYLNDTYIERLMRVISGSWIITFMLIFFGSVLWIAKMFFNKNKKQPRTKIT